MRIAQNKLSANIVSREFIPTPNTPIVVMYHILSCSGPIFKLIKLHYSVYYDLLAT